MEQKYLINFQPWLTALAKLQQNQAGFSALCVPHQPQPLGFHLFLCTAGDQLSQTLGLMYQKKVTAEFQRLAGSGKQIGRGAVILPPCDAVTLTCGTAGKIGGIGNAAMIAAGLPCKIPQVSAYTG